MSLLLAVLDTIQPLLTVFQTLRQRGLQCVNTLPKFIHTPNLDSELCNVWNLGLSTFSRWEIQHLFHVSILSLSSENNWEREREQGSISGHHLKLCSQTFYDCWAKWIWDTGNSLYLSSRQPHFLAPCSPLPRSHWLPGVKVLIFQRQTGAPTLLGLNRLDVPL